MRNEVNQEVNVLYFVYCCPRSVFRLNRPLCVDLPEWNSSAFEVLSAEVLVLTKVDILG